MADELSPEDLHYNDWFKNLPKAERRRLLKAGLGPHPKNQDWRMLPHSFEFQPRRADKSLEPDDEQRDQTDQRMVTEGEFRIRMAAVFELMAKAKNPEVRRHVLIVRQAMGYGEPRSSLRLARKLGITRQALYLRLKAIRDDLDDMAAQGRGDKKSP